MRTLSSNFILKKNTQTIKPIFLYTIEDYNGSGTNLTYTNSVTDITFDGIVYTKFSITHSTISENIEGSLSSVQLTIGNVSRLFEGYVDTYDFRGKKVTIKLVYGDNLTDTTGYLEDTFYIDSISTSSSDSILFNLVSKLDVLSLTLPYRIFSRNICTWKFKDTKCAYAGAESTCNKTFARCKELANSLRFGGFPSIPCRKFATNYINTLINPVYNSQGPQTTQEAGITIPIIYGESIASGNVISQYIYSSGEKTYLNILLGISEGEIEEISTIKINDTAISEYTEHDDDARYGTNTQTVITNFEDVHDLITVDIEIEQATPYIYTTTSSILEGFDLQFECPSGLYIQSTSDSSYESTTIQYKVEYKLTTDSVYTLLDTYTFSSNSTGVVKRNCLKQNLTAGKYNIKITKISNDSSSTSMTDFYLKYVDELTTDDLTYPNTALLSVKYLDEEQASTTFPNITCLVKGVKVSCPKIMNGVTQVEYDDYYWDPTALVFKLLSDDTVLSWDGTTYVTQYSANPVWCLRDLLINSRYGLGEFIDTTDLDEDSFLAMSKYCDERIDDGDGGYEKRYRLDYTITGNSSALDVLNEITSVFQGMLSYTNNTIKLIIDKTGSSSYLFGMGDIIQGSFSQTWRAKKEIANVVEASFYDSSKNYTTDKVLYTNETSLADGDSLRKKSITCLTKSVSQAIRTARYTLKKLLYTTKTINFDVGQNGLAVEVGDIITVSHDVPLWGYSGRVKTGSTTTSIILDRNITISAGVTYKLKVRLINDTIEEKTVTNSPGVTNTITVSSGFTSMNEYNSYIFGIENYVGEDFRITNLARDSSEKITINAELYDSNVYDDTAPNLPDTNYSELITTVEEVENLTLTEGLLKKSDGTYQHSISVWFNKPTVSVNSAAESYRYSEIYLSDDSGVSWNKIGLTYGENYTITSELLVPNGTYEVAVRSIGQYTALSLTNSPSESITLNGGSTLPPDVENLEIYGQGNDLNFIGKDVKFKWAKRSHFGAGDTDTDDNTAGEAYEDISFKDFEVQIIVDSRIVRTEYIVDNVYTYSFENNTYDNGIPQESFTIRVYQRNYYNKRSSNYAELTVTNPIPKTITGVSYDFSGKDLVLSWNPRTNADPDFRRYKIEIVGTGGTNTYYRDATSFFYSYDENVNQNGSTGDRSLTVNLYAEDYFGQLSEVYSFEANNIVPATPILSATGFFNSALLQWTDSNDTDLKYYEIWQSTTGTWGGEEFLLKKSTGTSEIVKVDSTDNILYFKIRGVDTFGEGSFSTQQSVTFVSLNENDLGCGIITCTHISDGSITTPKLAANAVTASKITTGELITLSAQIKDGIIENAHIVCLDAGKINTGELCADRVGAGTICVDKGISIVTCQSAYQKTTFDAYGIKSYDSDGDLRLWICDGHIEAQDIKFKDPNCDCCYSFLNSGALQFHDEGGDVPYVKRILSGEICTGGTICLPFWKTSPYIIVSMKSLRSYDSTYCAQCQSYCVYYDTPVCYINSYSDYGYCAILHAELRLSEGQAAECVKDINFNDCTYTSDAVCETCVRMKFNLWNSNNGSGCYQYGDMGFWIYYRVYGSGSWCCTSTLYSQITAPASESELKEVKDRYYVISFPCSACWQLMAVCESIAFYGTTISYLTVTCCTCTRTAGNITPGDICIYCGGGTCTATTNLGNSSFTGAAPSNIFCNILHYNYALNICIRAGATNTSTYAWACTKVYTAWNSWEVNLGCTNYGYNCSASCCGVWSGECTMAVGTISNLSIDYTTCVGGLYIGSGCYGFGNTCISGVSFSNICLTQCYCTTSGGGECCTSYKLYSLFDTYGCACVLDPAGIVNWLAISYG